MSSDKHAPLKDGPGASALGAGRKKAYVKPSFTHEAVFETMALTCGKISSTQAQCANNRKNS